MAKDERERPDPRRRQPRTGEAHADGEPRAGPKDPDRIEVEIAAFEVVAALARLDLEAALAYEAAVEAATDAELESHLRELAREHRGHLDALNEALEAEGEPAVALASAPGAGPALEGLVRLAGALGDEVLTVALLGNEQLTNLSYDAALAYEWDADTEAMLRRFQQDEERHVAWLASKHESLGSDVDRPDAPP